MLNLEEVNGLRNMTQLWSWRSGVHQDTYRSVSVSSMDSSVEEILKESVAVSPESAHWFPQTPRTQLPTSTRQRKQHIDFDKQSYNSFSIQVYDQYPGDPSVTEAFFLPTFEPVLCISAAVLKITLLQTNF